MTCRVAASFNNLLHPFRSTFQKLLILSLVINLLSLMVPIYVLQVYDRVIFRSGLTTLQGLLIGMVLVLLFEFLLRSGRTRILQHSGAQISETLGQSIYKKILSLPLEALESRTAQQWQMLFRDGDTVRNRYSGQMAMLMLDIPFGALALLLILTIATPISWVVLTAIPLFMLIAWRSASVIHQHSIEERNQTIQRDQLINESISVRTTIKARQQDQHFLNLWEQQQKQWHISTLKRSHSSDHYRDLSHSMSLLTTITLTAAGALAIIHQELTLGALIATNMLSSRILSPLTQLVSQWKNFTLSRTAVENLDKLFQQPSEEERETVVPDTIHGELKFEQLSFLYQQEEHATIHNISGRIGPNGIHAIVGPNGSGKSTLLKLLAGLYQPSKGRILIDGTELQQYPNRVLGSWIGYLPQQVITLNGTIQENLIAGCSSANDTTIIEACQQAGAYDFISQLEAGFSTAMGESGYRFSGGERKRIAIASLLIKQPRILLLDEPTESLDITSLQTLLQTLQQLAANHTIIVVTHNPVLLKISNSILLLQQGKITAAGPSQEMLSKLGVTP